MEQITVEEMLKLHAIGMIAIINYGQLVRVTYEG